MRQTEERMRALGLLTPTSLLTLDEWEIPRDRVVINRKLGEGAFGTVYGGEAFFDEKGWVSQTKCCCAHTTKCLLTKGEKSTQQKVALAHVSEPEQKGLRGIFGLLSILSSSRRYTFDHQAPRTTTTTNVNNNNQ